MSVETTIRARLPIHGFVLAGGQSSRMGRDKATLEFLGRPMVEIAVEKLRTFCADVSIAGNRDDLAHLAPMARETRSNTGPAAGIEAGLQASKHPWAIFIPVDVPLVPADLLHRWARATIENTNCSASFLIAQNERQPAFCMLHQRSLTSVRDALDRGERKLAHILYAPDDADTGWLWPVNATRFAPGATDLQMEFRFTNINTPRELAGAEAWAQANA